jgi:enoyl-CoA hydratase
MSYDSYTSMRFERLDDVLRVTLANPRNKVNAVDGEMHAELVRLFEELKTERAARAVILTGGGRAFCVGQDLREHADNLAAGRGLDGTLLRDYNPIIAALAGMPKPVVAAVNGPAIGAGTQLALAADLRVAAPTAVFAIPTAKIGLAVDPWTIRRFAHLAGNGTARAVLLACAQLDARQAHACGFAERLGSVDDALAWAAEMAELAPLTVAYSKQVLNNLVDSDAGEGEKALLRAFEACWASEDFAEGRRARAERRAPRFEGR